MKLQFQPGTLHEAYLYLATWRDLEDGQIFKTYITYTNPIADLSTVTTELEPLFEHAILIAITEVDITNILIELDQEE
jgi:hypothetical protein